MSRSGYGAPQLEKQFNIRAKTDSEPDCLGLLGQMPTLLLKSCVTSGKLFNLSEPQFPHLQNGDNNVTYLGGLFSELMS